MTARKPETDRSEAAGKLRMRNGRTNAAPFADRLAGRREQIFVAAAHLFLEKGFAATSMSEIAAAVGITKAGLYHFIENKEELLYTLMTFAMDLLVEDVVQPARMISDPLDRLALIVRNHLYNVSRSVEIVTITMNEPAGLTPERRAEIRRRKRDYYDFVRDTLRALQADGRLQPGVDPTVGTFAVLGMVLWFNRWHRPDGPRSLDEVAPEMVQIALASVISPEILARRNAGMTSSPGQNPVLRPKE